MAGSNNTTSIDSVVDPIAVEQFNQLKVSGKELRTELVVLLETAIKLNTTLGGSTPATFAKNLQASTAATDKIIANNNKQIENEVKKAAKQDEIYNKYLILLSKQEQARQQVQAKQDAADAKEIQKAEAKASKLKAISDKAEAERIRKSNVQFPTGNSNAYNPVTSEPDTTSVRYEPIITGNENMAISATKSAEATAAQSLALAEQKEVMDGLSTSYRANIELLLTLQSERAANATELKALNVEDAASGERAVFLTAEQLRLSTAISETNLTLSQQTKQINAADTSIVQMQASLNELRVSYNNLTLAERENIEIGAVYLAEIETLDTAVKEAAIAQGIHNKNVGAYTTATEIADKVSAQFIRQLVRMAAQFLLITVVFGALSWLYDFIKGMDVFTGRLDQNKQAWDAWSAVMKEGNKNAAEQLVKLDELNKAAQDNNITEKERIKAAETMKELWPDKLKNLSDEAIMNGTVKKSIDEVTESIEKQALAQAGLSKLTEIAAKELDLKTQRDKLNYAKADNIIATNKGNGYDRLSTMQQLVVSQTGIPSKDDLKKIFKNDTDEQQADISAQLSVLANTKKIIEDNIGTSALAGAAEGKPKKGTKLKKVSDTANTDLLEAQRIAIEAAKKASQAILDNDNQTYEAKIAALAAYQSQSKQLIDVAEKIALADTNLREQQRKNIIEKFRLDGLDVDHEIAAKKEQLDKEVLAKHKATLSELVTADQQAQQEQLEDLNQGAIVAAQVLQNQRDKLLDAKNDEYDRGRISEKQYNRDILAINDQYAIDRLNAELVVQNAILEIRKATRDKELAAAVSNGATPEELAKITGNANRGIDTTTNSIASITGQLGTAVNKKKRDDLQGGKGEDKDTKKDIAAALENAQQIIGNIKGLSDGLYESQISNLEKVGEKIRENAQIESDAINNSLDTQANKARRKQVLDAQTASQQKALNAQIAAEKTKQARADKVSAIAEIILNTAIAATKVTAQSGLLGLLTGVPAVIALGAISLAKVIATPIPQFYKGGITKGGPVIYGERGRELVEEPGRAPYYSPGVATLVDLPANTRITANNMLPKTPKWESNGTGAAQVVNVKIDTPKQRQPRLMGWVEAQRQADSWGRYSGNYFK
jgi:hypothetical protein